jgi:putative hemolysin
MDQIFLEILVFVMCLVFSAFFSGAEAALLSIGVKRTKQLIEVGDSKAHAFEFMVKNTNEIFTTILVGNNFVNIFAATFASNIVERMFENNALAISVGVSTGLILFFGEIIPKTFFRNRAETYAYPSILVLKMMYYITFPLIKGISALIHIVLGKNAKLNDRFVTQEDIEFLVNEAEKEKTIDSKQIDLLNSILEFPTIKVRDIMVPRTQVHALDSKIEFEEVIGVIKEQGHSRYPVYEKDLDRTLGFLHVKDLAFVSPKERENFNIEKYLKKPFFIYEHMKIQSVFDHMNRKKVHLAMVKDENGIIVGIITLEDIMEEIFGEISDEHDDEEDNNEELLQNGIIVPASISLRDLYNDYDVKIPLNDNYSTLTGFILDMLGNNFPRQGNIIFWEGYAFTLKKVKNSEIIEVKIEGTDNDSKLIRKHPEDDEKAKNDAMTAK